MLKDEEVLIEEDEEELSEEAKKILAELEADKKRKEDAKASAAKAAKKVRKLNNELKEKEGRLKEIKIENHKKKMIGLGEMLIAEFGDKFSEKKLRIILDEYKILKGGE